MGLKQRMQAGSLDDMEFSLAEAEDQKTLELEGAKVEKEVNTPQPQK